MFSLASEIERLRPHLGDARTEAELARETGRVFSIYPELRIAAWAGVMLLVSAAGLILKNNLDRIGPLGLAILMALAAAACYVWAARHRDRASLADDYILLLGALLLSGDVAFIEAQFHVLGDAWRQHLLLIALLHGITAYVFCSRLVLSLAITSLAGWIGADPKAARPRDFATAAYLTVVALLVWRELDRRFANTDFTRTIEHFTANLALLGGLMLMDVDITLGCMVTMAAAAAVMVWGYRVRSEWFALYAFVYFVIAADVLLIHWMDDVGNDVTIAFIIFVSMIAAIVALFRIHALFRAREKSAESAVL